MKTSDFNSEQFELKILLDISLEEAYRYISTSDGLESWFLGEVTFFNREGSKQRKIENSASYHWKWQKEHSTSGKVLGYKENEFVHMDFGNTFDLRMEVYERGNKTELRLVQRNLEQTESLQFGYINCCVCWTFFMTNLKSVAEHGIDLREQDVIDESFVNQ